MLISVYLEYVFDDQLANVLIQIKEHFLFCKIIIMNSMWRLVKIYFSL